MGGAMLPDEADGAIAANGASAGGVPAAAKVALVGTEGEADAEAVLDETVVEDPKFASASGSGTGEASAWLGASGADDGAASKIPPPGVAPPPPPPSPPSVGVRGVSCGRGAVSSNGT